MSVIIAIAKAITGSIRSWLIRPIKTFQGCVTIFLISWKEMDNPNPRVMIARVIGRNISEKIFDMNDYKMSCESSNIFKIGIFFIQSDIFNFSFLSFHYSAL